MDGLEQVLSILSSTVAILGFTFTAGVGFGLWVRRYWLRRQVRRAEAEANRQAEAEAAERERIRNMGPQEYAEHKRRTDPDWPYDWKPL